MLEKLRSRFVRFMYGRYGNDPLNRALLVVTLAVLFVNVFAQFAILEGLILLLIIVSNFRAFSKNIYKRQMENQKYLQLMKPLSKEYKLTVRRIKEGKDYSFKKCPKCHQVLRLSRKRGRHSTVCPKCGEKMKVHIL